MDPKPKDPFVRNRKLSLTLKALIKGVVVSPSLTYKKKELRVLRTSPCRSPRIFKRGELLTNGGNKQNANFSFNNVEKWPSLNVKGNASNEEGMCSRNIDDAVNANTVMSDIDGSRRSLGRSMKLKVEYPWKQPVCSYWVKMLLLVLMVKGMRMVGVDLVVEVLVIKGKNKVDNEITNYGPSGHNDASSSKKGSVGSGSGKKKEEREEWNEDVYGYYKLKLQELVRKTNVKDLKLKIHNLDMQIIHSNKMVAIESRNKANSMCKSVMAEQETWSDEKLKFYKYSTGKEAFEKIVNQIKKDYVEEMHEDVAEDLSGTSQFMASNVVTIGFDVWCGINKP
nr:hypothetical protein [Tanacetum cinerariifolium]